ncbi:MAG: glycosyltransferase [Sphingobacteriales bacterium]|nr:glycosyltransferase [Sphingobacteriales bacterium]
MSTNKQILYISYDGMTDPLGQSQVLPYLCGLAREGYRFTILSFEKKDRYEKGKETILEITRKAGIQWVPLRFTSRPPVLSKFYDAIRMRRTAFRLHRENRFDMVHCRSYIAADLGLKLKRKTGTKFFFDMRGFWADEKKEAGTWNQDRFIFRQVYHYYKKKEKEFIREADHIISLTEAGRLEMQNWTAYNPAVPMSVIPCCADMDHFTLTSAAGKAEGRARLGLPADALVVSYLGSVGSWYMLDEMLELFALIKTKYATARFLFITHSPAQLILAKLKNYGLRPDDILITEAGRKEVPVFTKASDISLSFIKPVYSKLSSSPTKLGELLSMGIPVIVNSGVGDVETIVHKSGGGFVLQAFTRKQYQAALEALPALLKREPALIRENIRTIYSLEEGIKSYSKAYSSCFSNKTVTAHE